MTIFKRLKAEKIAVMMDVKFNKNLLTWLAWFLLVVLWNYGFPNASPFLDVLVAVILSLLMIVYKRIIK